MTREEYSPDWDRLRRRVFERDRYRCRSCGRGGGPRGDAVLHADHVRPRSEGGTDELTNLVTLCERCHAAKHDSALLEEAADRDRRRQRARQGRRRGPGRSRSDRRVRR